MGHLRSQRHIDAPPALVFETIASPERLPEVNPAVRKVEFLTEQRSGLGTRFRETRVMGGREAESEFEYTEHEAPERVRIVTDAGGAVWDTVMTVTPGAEGGAELTLEMEDRPHKLMARLFIPLMRGTIDKGVTHDLDCLKAYCESAAGAGEAAVGSDEDGAAGGGTSEDASEA